MELAAFAARDAIDVWPVDKYQETAGLSHRRLYEYRFRDVDQARRLRVWREVARFLYRALGTPETILDPAAGRGEFITTVPAKERWAVDAVDHADFADPGVKVIISDILDADLPEDYFDAVLVSNFLEHLPDADTAARILSKLLRTLHPGGRLAVMGPNFRFCSKTYFDCADHTLVLTHVSAAEHLVAAGFELTTVISRFLPYSFRSGLPASPLMTRLYLRWPVMWKLLGKQFLVLAERPRTDEEPR
ncbi:MAG TPA: class I SAM-dependent methyltransferase [Streptosporangiaceae bacterium]